MMSAASVSYDTMAEKAVLFGWREISVVCQFSKNVLLIGYEYDDSKENEITIKIKFMMIINYISDFLKQN